MGLVTFLSDFGNTDHYVAAVKGAILKVNPNLNIIDISHEIRPGDLAHASYVMRMAFKNFPDETVHLTSIIDSTVPSEKYLALKIEGHYFLGQDNGIWGLISDKNASAAIDICELNSATTTFPARDILAPMAAKLASGTAMQDLGPAVTDYKKMIRRQVKATKSLISGHIIHIDHFGNLITNIVIDDFEILSKNRSYNIVFGRENVKRVQTNYNQVENGECFVLFNSSGLMEIGINNGNASQLLGLSYDTPVKITFED